MEKGALALKYHYSCAATASTRQAVYPWAPQCQLIRAVNKPGIKGHAYPLEATPWGWELILFGITWLFRWRRKIKINAWRRIFIEPAVGKGRASRQHWCSLTYQHRSEVHPWKVFWWGNQWLNYDSCQNTLCSTHWIRKQHFSVYMCTFTPHIVQTSPAQFQTLHFLPVDRWSEVLNTDNFLTCAC